MEEKVYFHYTKELIDETAHKFLYVLMKCIFFGKNFIAKNSWNKLLSFTGKINEIYNVDININKLHENDICNIDNMKAIIKFVRIQNPSMSSEILENIIIRLISFTFNIRSSEFFGKYIYNNLKFIRYNKLEIAQNWMYKKMNVYLFNIGKDGNNGSRNLQEILNCDFALSNSSSSNANNPSSSQIDHGDMPITNSIFFEVLIEILKGRVFVNEPINEKQNNENATNTGFSDLTSKTIFGNYTSIYYNASCLFYSKYLNKAEENFIIPLATRIIISSYIYYQNRHSPLMKYIKDSKNLVNLPFIYELSEAGIIDSYLGIVIAPIRIEPRIEDVELNKNIIKIEGILELFKAIIFNKSIKKISIKSCITKAKYFQTFSKFLKYFDNDSVEELDMSSNYLRSDADTILFELISKLRGLKTLILSYNNLKSGIASLFVALKKLYKQKKTKLETLILIKCTLDDISFYELGELLKSKYCQLKCLCLNENKIPSNTNFFKSLKKNRSLKEIYLYDCGINSDNGDDIDRIISNSDFEILYLNQNQIHDFNQYIRILHRNCLIKNEEEKQNENIFVKEPGLYNLNINGSDCFNRNSKKIELTREGIIRTNLTCLDLTSALKGNKIRNEGSMDYYNEIKIIEDYLQKMKDEHKDLSKEIMEKDVEKKRLEEKIDEKNRNEFEKLEIDIEEIINDNKSKYNSFIIQKANERKSILFNNKKEDKFKMEQFVDYIRLKRVEKILKEKKKIAEKKKLILI